jgi:transcriptional antiterminator RfaH
MDDKVDIVDVTSSSGIRWYVVQARPRQEERAATNLASWGVRTFLPMIRQPARRRSRMAAPLFPRYLFVQCSIAETVQKIRYTRGVAKVLGTGDGPTAVDDTIIQCIQSRIGADGFVELSDPIGPGDPVVITSGPLKGLVAIFSSASSAANRVVLLLEAVSSQIRLLVEPDILRRVTGEPRGTARLGDPLSVSE